MGCGGIMSEVIDAAKILSEHDINVDVVSLLTVKPIDEEVIVGCGEDRIIVTVEEHNLDGGLGSAVSEVITDNNLNTRLIRIGIKNKFIEEVGTQAYLRKINGLDAESIVEKIKHELH